MAIKVKVLLNDFDWGTKTGLLTIIEINDIRKQHAVVFSANSEKLTHYEVVKALVKCAKQLKKNIKPSLYQRFINYLKGKL